MKNKKIVVLAFLLIAAMVVGVGYAALTDTLTINGDLEFSIAEVNESFDEDVYFSAVTISSADADGVDVNPNDTTKLSASIVTNDPDKITFNAKNMWSQVDQTVTIVATIENSGENVNKAAQLAVTVNAETGADYFEGISKTFSTSSVTGANVETAGLPVGESCTLTIVFKCKELPTTADTASVIYNLIATAVD